LFDIAQNIHKYKRLTKNKLIVFHMEHTNLNYLWKLDKKQRKLLESCFMQYFVAAGQNKDLLKSTEDKKLVLNADTPNK